MHLGCAEFHYSGHAATALCVPLLWYFIGRLIDNSDSARLRRYTRARKFWAYLTRLKVSTSTLLSGVKGVTGTSMSPRRTATNSLRSDIGSDSSYHFSMQHVLAARAASLTKFKCAARQASRLERHDLLRLGAEPVDAEFDHVAGPQIFRLHLAADADARGRAGGDHVARLQHEELRAIPNDMLAVEDHVAGVAILARSEER